MRRAQWLELLALTLMTAAAAAALPLHTGYGAWSWDALNHHIYLGLTAESPRWDLDVIPANFQTYQYPYLYWPVYRLSLLDGRGAWIGATWAAFQAAMLLPPIWFVCYRLLPGGRGHLRGLAERVAGCALAFTSVVILAGLETTANDLLAAVPLLWAVGIMLARPSSDRHAFCAAALWGVASAFKLSNGIYLPLLLIWWWLPTRPHIPARRGLALAAGGLVGFGLLYAPWGWQLWHVVGNPFHPFLSQYFGGV